MVILKAQRDLLMHKLTISFHRRNEGKKLRKYNLFYNMHIQIYKTRYIYQDIYPANTNYKVEPHTAPLGLAVQDYHVAGSCRPPASGACGETTAAAND